MLEPLRSRFSHQWIAIKNCQWLHEHILKSMDRDQELSMVARAYIEIGQVKTAEDLARGITDVNEREQVLGAIALQYAKTAIYLKR